jgi:hypothetical protein
MSAPIKWGEEFLVNTTLNDNQFAPTIAALANGRFIVAWTDISTTAPDTSAAAVRAQIFNADGTPHGNEFIVNSTFPGAQSQPSVAALPDGGFVVAWTEEELIAQTDTGILARIFDANGSPAGDEFLVTTNLTQRQNDPSVTALEGGGFVVTWTDANSAGDGSSTCIKAQIYQANGLPLGGEFLVNTETDFFQGAEVVTGLANGGFVVTWMTDDATGDSDGAVAAKIFDADGIVVKDERSPRAR